ARGTVTLSPAGVTPQVTCDNLEAGADKTCTFAYPVDREVTLTATPAPGDAFVGWGGACTGNLDCTVRMSEARAVMATFGRTRTLTVTVRGVDQGRGRLIVSPPPRAPEAFSSCDL